jgi:hypothetical protein
MGGDAVMTNREETVTIASRIDAWDTVFERLRNTGQGDDWYEANKIADACYRYGQAPYRIATITVPRWVADLLPDEES